jgi:hypothetical protein
MPVYTLPTRVFIPAFSHSPDPSGPGRPSMTVQLAIGADWEARKSRIGIGISGAQNGAKSSPGGAKSRPGRPKKAGGDVGGVINLRIRPPRSQWFAVCVGSIFQRKQVSLIQS